MYTLISICGLAEVMSLLCTYTLSHHFWLVRRLQAFIWYFVIRLFPYSDLHRWNRTLVKGWFSYKICHWWALSQGKDGRWCFRCGTQWGGWLILIGQPYRMQTKIDRHTTALFTRVSKNVAGWQTCSRCWDKQPPNPHSLMPEHDVDWAKRVLSLLFLIRYVHMTKYEVTGVGNDQNAAIRSPVSYKSNALGNFSVVARTLASHGSRAV
jgi:hypothetical protein